MVTALPDVTRPPLPAALRGRVYRHPFQVPTMGLDKPWRWECPGCAAYGYTTNQPAATRRLDTHGKVWHA